MDVQKAYTLGVPEIISCLNDVGIKIKTEDLIQTEERKENIKRIFEQLAEISLGIPRDEINQASLSGIQSMTYPELHDESLQQMNCFKILQQLFDRYGIKDFCLNDITNPTPKRLRIQLSYAVNFLKYREERLDSLSEHDKQRVILNNQLNKIQLNKEEIEKNVLLKQNKVDEQLETVNRIEIDIKDYENKISKLNIYQAEIRENSSQLKTKNNELKDIYTSKQLQLEELLNKKKILLGQIVSSPEKLKKQLDTTSNSLQLQYTEIKNCEKKLKEINSWNEYIVNAMNDVQLGKEAIDCLSNEMIKNKEVNNEIISKEQSLIIQKDILKTLQQNTLQLNRKIARHEEKNNHLKQQAELRAIEATATMDKLQSDIILSTNIKNDVHVKVEMLENEVYTMKKLVDSERIVQEQEINDIKESYQRMETVVINHLKNLRNAITINTTNNENLPPVPLTTNTFV